MIELTFMAGNEITQFKIDGKNIYIKSKQFGYKWVLWNPVGLSADQLAKLKVVYGEKWYEEYLQAEERFREMDTDEQIAEDLINDFKKTGMKLVRRKDDLSK